MKIVCAGYREWALKIYDNISHLPEHTFLIFRSKEQYNEKILREFNPDLILFYGWSWIIPETLLEDHKALMLHPSDLPKYRGGSPIQNQILDGVKESKVTVFLMTKELDAGDIWAQEDLSLEGSVSDIFDRLTRIGTRLTLKILSGDFSPIEQDHSQATYCKRRQPEDSEITLQELSTMPSEYLYDKIRMLADPYPNAFIRTIDNKKLILKEAVIED